MRVLAVTKIFPNAAEPLSSPFNRQQFAALGRMCELEVMASLPWFPGARALRRWSPAGKLTEVPRSEVIDGLSVLHPRTLYVPRVGHALSGLLYAGSLAPELARYRGRIDVVLGSWAYPDGCAAVALAAALGVPAVVKLHGSDINVLADMAGPRWFIKRLLPRAQRVVAVSRALRDRVVELGVQAPRVRVVYNGVNGELFHLADRARARAELGLDPGRRIALYVGHLKRTKGVLDLAEAWREVAERTPDAQLAVVGDGPHRPEMEAALEGLGDRVVMAGARPLAEIPRWMAACDLLTLPSWNEGCPNVLLEAAACGRRVVATRVGGIPELVYDPAIGELVDARAPRALTEALASNLGIDYDPRQVAALGARGDWNTSAAELLCVLYEAVEDAAR